MPFLKCFFRFNVLQEKNIFSVEKEKELFNEQLQIPQLKLQNCFAYLINDYFFFLEITNAAPARITTARQRAQ